MPIYREVSRRVLALSEPGYYVSAQFQSFNNRWATWLEGMDAQIKTSHLVGRRALAQGLEAFAQVVSQDLDAGWAELIVEPAEWLKLGMHY